MVICYKLDLKKKNKKNWKRAWNMDKISIFDYNVENVPKVEEYSVCQLTIRISSCKAETTWLTSFLYLCCSRRKLCSLLTSTFFTFLHVKIKSESNPWFSTESRQGFLVLISVSQKQILLISEPQRRSEDTACYLSVWKDSDKA